MSKFRVDHAAQFITSPVTTGADDTSWKTGFDRQVQDWIDKGVLRESAPDSMYVFEKLKNAKKTTTNSGGASNGNSNGWTMKCINPTNETTDSTSVLKDQQKQRQRFCYPPGGMSSLVDALVTGSTFDIRQDVWVSPSSGVRYEGPPPPQGSAAKNGVSRDSWSVRAQGRTLGKHDHLIVAHNGKCADRLMSKTPAKDVHRLLRTNFNDRVPANGGQKMTLNSIYSLTFCLKGPSLLSQNLPESFVGGFVQEHPRLGLVTCQTNKYPSKTYSEDDQTNDDNLEVWTVLSTACFAKKNKAPQEFLPEDVVQNVTRLLVDSLQNDIIGGEVAVNGGDAVLRNQILDARVQLWGAAVPLNVWRGDTGPSASDPKQSSPGFVHDPRYQLGVCGDWLLEASIAGAWTSGRRLAEHLIDTDHSTSAKYVGFKKGYFEASQSVRQLGLASLDGPMNSQKKIIPSSPQRSTNNNNNNGQGGKGNNNGKRNNNRRRNPNQNRNRKQNPNQKQIETSTA